MKKVLFLLLALMMSTAVKAQEIEKVDKFTSGYITSMPSATKVPRTGSWYAILLVAETPPTMFTRTVAV